jgi:hypothetical protein
MDALVHCPLLLAGCTKAATTRWLNCNQFVHTKIKHSPYLEPLIVLCFIGPQRIPTRLCLDLMVGQEEVLCDPVPWLTIIMVLLVPLRPEILVVKLSNQKVNILTRVGHGRFSLILKILLVRKLIMVMLQFATQQELQTISFYGPPRVQIHLKTLV